MIGHLSLVKGGVLELPESGVDFFALQALAGVGVESVAVIERPIAIVLFHRLRTHTEYVWHLCIGRKWYH